MEVIVQITSVMYRRYQNHSGMLNTSFRHLPWITFGWLRSTERWSSNVGLERCGFNWFGIGAIMNCVVGES